MTPPLILTTVTVTITKNLPVGFITNASGCFIFPKRGSSLILCYSVESEYHRERACGSTLRAKAMDNQAVSSDKSASSSLSVLH